MPSSEQPCSHGFMPGGCLYCERLRRAAAELERDSLVEELAGKQKQIERQQARIKWLEDWKDACEATIQREITKRQQAEVERDIAIQSIAELAETLRVVRNTQGGRFGLAWADVERMVNTTLGYPQQPDVTTLAASQTEMSPEAKRTLYGNMRDLYVSADDVPAPISTTGDSK